MIVRTVGWLLAGAIDGSPYKDSCLLQQRVSCSSSHPCWYLQHPYLNKSLGTMNLSLFGKVSTTQNGPMVFNQQFHCNVSTALSRTMPSVIHSFAVTIIHNKQEKIYRNQWQLCGNHGGSDKLYADTRVVYLQALPN